MAILRLAEELLLLLLKDDADAADIERVRAQWGFAAEAWGYEPPAPRA